MFYHSAFSCYRLLIQGAVSQGSRSSSIDLAFSRLASLVTPTASTSPVDQPRRSDLSVSSLATSTSHPLVSGCSTPAAAPTPFLGCFSLGFFSNCATTSSYRFFSSGNILVSNNGQNITKKTLPKFVHRLFLVGADDWPELFKIHTRVCPRAHFIELSPLNISHPAKSTPSVEVQRIWHFILHLHSISRPHQTPLSTLTFSILPFPFYSIRFGSLVIYTQHYPSLLMQGSHVPPSPRTPFIPTSL